VREAAGYKDTLVELFATVEAAERYADIVGEARDAGARVHLADEQVIADISTTVTPQGLVGVCRFLDTPFEEILRPAQACRRARQCAGSRERRHRSAVRRCRRGRGRRTD
jgi:TrmH family RNA methyltransferase